ncbi:MAG TPA: Do family serine endopeptidase [Caulifigura sp.]|nr:Do family serine endopeptidase [Caulifigura sp.]
MKTASRGTAWVLTVVASMSLGAGAMVWSQPKPTLKAPLKTPTDLSLSFREAARHVLPSVVSIRSVTKGGMQTVRNNDDGDIGQMGEEELFRRFFGEGMPRGNRGGRRFQPQQIGTGSGVIIDSSGVILTNSHVVASADEVTVELQTGQRLKAKSWATDPRRDVAIVKVESSEPLPAADIGDSDDMQIGDWVLALGNPFNVGTSVTQGIISATGRGTGINELESYLQTDAAVNPGNSGGPLINLNGQVVGINTAISSNSGGYDGVSFAIPINMVRGVADQLIATGKVSRSYLGIGLQPLDEQLQNYFNVKDGVLVTLVTENTPASKAGVKTRDIIVELAGKKISSRTVLMNMVDALPPGKPQSMVVLRDGKKVELTVTPEQMPEGYTPALKSTMKTAAPEPADEKSESKLGITVMSISTEVAQQLGLKDDVKGVVVRNLELGGAAQEAGLSRGDVITSVNQKSVTTPAEFGEALKAGDPKKGHLLEVHRDGASLLVVVHPTE